MKYEKYEIFLNFECNARCIFCSIGHMFNKDKRIKQRDEVLREIKTAKEHGVKTISFSGGEPTIRKDLIKFVEYAKEIGFKTIEIQSNGMMYCYDDYVKELVDAGANRFLVSIHGSNARVHDFLTRVNGSFEKTMKGVENLYKRKVDLRFSIVINKYNYKELEQWAKMLLKYEGFSYHLNYITPIGFAKESYKKLAPRISEVVPEVKKAVGVILNAGLGPWIHNIYPCNMLGYEGMMSELMEKKTMISGADFKADIDKTKMEGREKPKTCKKCKFNLMCAGPYKKYFDVYGSKEFKPIKGEMIKNIKFQKYGKIK